MRTTYLHLLAIASVACGHDVAAAPDASLKDGRSLVFEALRGNAVVGHHTIRFTQTGDVLAVDVSIFLKSKIFIVPFTYTHTNHELWRGNRLLSLESVSTTNSSVTKLSAKSVISGSAQQGVDVISDGKTSHIRGSIMSTSYWLADMARQSRLLNSQTGAVIATKLIADNAMLAQTTLGYPIAAREYQMTGSKRFNANPLYDSSGCLVGLNFKVPFDGTRITYRLLARPDASLAPDLAANPLLANCLINRRTALQNPHKPS